MHGSMVVMSEATCHSLSQSSNHNWEQSPDKCTLPLDTPSNPNSNPYFHPNFTAAGQVLQGPGLLWRVGLL